MVIGTELHRPTAIVIVIITLWIKVVLEKLSVAQIYNTFTGFCGT
jgi:hypothetical protein